MTLESVPAYDSEHVGSATPPSTGWTTRGHSGHQRPHRTPWRRDDTEEILNSKQTFSEDDAYYPFPSNRRRYYEKLDRFPGDLLVVGDAIANSNPVYGERISVAALHALVLHHTLADDGLGNLSVRFFDEAKPVIDTAWLIAVGADFQFPQTTGPKPRGAGLMGWYLSRRTRKAPTDGELAQRLFRVIVIEKSPPSLFRSSVMGRVLEPSIQFLHHTNT